MSAEDNGVNNPVTIIEITLVTTKGVVFSQRIADSIHNACWWLQENAELVQELWDKHINDEPQIQMKDVANPLGHDL